MGAVVTELITVQTKAADIHYHNATAMTTAITLPLSPQLQHHVVLATFAIAAIDIAKTNSLW